MTTINNIAYNYNKDFKYTGEEKMQLCPITKKEYLLPANATTVKPIKYNNELEEIKFDITKNKWLKENIKLNGTFYLKIDGIKETTIFKKDKDLYTTVKPTLTIFKDIDSVDTIIFENDKWIYKTTTQANINFHKEQKINIIKSYTGQLINAKYPMYKQLNIIRENLSDKILEMSNYIDALRSQSDLVEIKVNNLTTLDDIESFDIKNEMSNK